MNEQQCIRKRYYFCSDTSLFGGAINPPIIEIGESDTNEETTNPPSYAELFPMSNTPDIPPAYSDTPNPPIASSSRVPAEVTISTLVPSALRNPAIKNNGKVRAMDSQPFAIYSSSLNIGNKRIRTHETRATPNPINLNIATYSPVNRYDDVYRTHLAAASSCAFFTPYEHSKKIKTIEQLTGTRVNSTNPFDLVVL
ncbi:hypothetical protein AYI69_g5258 [Smittium culicis]|uniref:Uncharacterized protein n=1 Tax=Smittium culicis TaxID=133412 RepID=A0A1R1Y7E9_9FUNG|nr:hypothetical protein AYI69_g5258 [Smittium culicis]